MSANLTIFNFVEMFGKWCQEVNTLIEFKNKVQATLNPILSLTDGVNK